jgi:hypothetical protein
MEDEFIWDNNYLEINPNPNRKECAGGERKQRRSKNRRQQASSCFDISQIRHFYFRINNFPFHSRRFNIYQSFPLIPFFRIAAATDVQKGTKAQSINSTNFALLHTVKRQAGSDRNLLWQPIKGEEIAECAARATLRR